MPLHNHRDEISGLLSVVWKFIKTITVSLEHLIGTRAGYATHVRELNSSSGAASVFKEVLSISDAQGLFMVVH